MAVRPAAEGAGQRAGTLCPGESAEKWHWVAQEIEGRKRKQRFAKICQVVQHPLGVIFPLAKK